MERRNFFTILASSVAALILPSRFLGLPPQILTTDEIKHCNFLMSKMHKMILPPDHSTHSVVESWMGQFWFDWTGTEWMISPVKG